jgi:hypothetical protein
MPSGPALRRFSTTALVLVCGIVACTGDDEIYATPKDAGPLPDGTTSSSGGTTSSSSSSGGVVPDGSTTDSGDDGSTSTDGGDGGTTDGGTDSSVVDSGVDSGPVVCSTVACTSNLTCTALGCGSCNMGTKFCKP